MFERMRRHSCQVDLDGIGGILWGEWGVAKGQSCAICAVVATDHFDPRGFSGSVCPTCRVADPVASVRSVLRNTWFLRNDFL